MLRNLSILNTERGLIFEVSFKIISHLIQNNNSLKKQQEWHVLENKATF